MKNQRVNFKDKHSSYSIIIGENILRLIPNEIKKICPGTKKIALIIDKNVPSKYKKVLKTKLKNYNLFFFIFDPSEKSKSLKSANNLLGKLLSKNLNRSDLIISVGGGITGDVVGFIASIYKRGINFINVPTTLLAQVDSAIGGKTGVNSNYGKNLIGSFYQPKIVISDTNFLKTLPKKEVVCGYAEILKHSIIKDSKFFKWLKNNSTNILLRKPKELIYAIKKSCQIKMYFVNKDVNEKGLRMTLNYGHTFAHAIEIQNNYSKNLTHGEAVLAGMILATKLSVIKKVCDEKVLQEIKEIYRKNKLSYTLKKFSNTIAIKKLIPYLKNDKKNDDEKISLILLKTIGKTTMPGKYKFDCSTIFSFLLISQHMITLCTFKCMIKASPCVH